MSKSRFGSTKAKAPRLTIAQVKAQLNAAGMTITRDTVGSGPTGSGEYRVAVKVGAGMTKAQAEASAYYTPDLDDALQTGLMAAVHAQADSPAGLSAARQALMVSRRLSTTRRA